MSRRARTSVTADSDIGRPSRSLRHRLVRRTCIVLAVLFATSVFVLLIGPRFLPFQTLYVRSGSMRPTVPVGSLAVYRPVDAASLHAGDVIVFRKPSGHGAGELVTHRIVRVESGAHGRQFVTRGDANSTADPWRVPARGRGWRLWFSAPAAGYAVGVLESPLGHTWLLSALAVVAGVLLLIELWRPRPELAPAA
jgi:signal peptidase